MGIMYLAFFNASVVVAALAALAYGLFTYQQYRVAQAQPQPSRRAKGRAQVALAAPSATSQAPVRRATTSQSVKPSGDQRRTASGVALATNRSTSRPVSAAGKSDVRRPVTKVTTVNRDFAVADVTLPITTEAQAIGRLGTILLWLLAGTLTMALIMRAVITQHAPWTNMYEASIALAAFTTLAYLWFELRYQSRALGVGAAGIAFLLLLFAIWVGNAFNQAEPVAFKKIMPALQDNPILTIHVSLMIVSYAFFIVAFVCGVIILAQGPGAKARYAWLPAADAADELGYRAVTIGFPLLAAGIILGAWWANYAWGKYWSWDPKETSALITWLVYAIYLHARGLRGLRGNTIAWLLIAGFAATLFTYFGVSFIIPGLHSYAGVK